MDTELPVLAPSILAADYTKLGSEIDTCVNAGIEWIHCDIMDGHFVPNISYGPAVVKAANRASNAFMDVHLMIENPDSYVEAFVDAGADLLTVHQEACPHIHRTLQNIKSHGIAAGVAVNPGTPLSAIEPVLDDVDLVLIMSVNPGFGGQTFIEQTYRRLNEMRTTRENLQLDFLIEVDGGVGLENIEKIARSGADVLVAGSSVFKAKNIEQQISELLKKAKIGKGTLV